MLAGVVEPKDYDSIVIGAGLSGLSAARRLAEADQRVLVLEARDRVGGRSCTLNADDGTPVDVGAQWVGPTQKRVLALIEEFGIRRFDQFHEGRKHLALADRDSTYSGAIPSLPPWNLIDFQQALWRVDRLSRRVPLEAPAKAAGAQGWDAISLAGWMRKNVLTPGTRDLFRCACHAIFSVEPEEISFLHFLFYVRSAGGLMDLATVEGGAQAQRLIGGTQQLCERLADKLRNAGGELRLNAPVQRISWREAPGVEGAWGKARAQRIIVAMSPADAGRFTWNPPLPAQRQQLLNRMPMGSAIKCIAVYDKPFWRDAGYSGELFGDGDPLTMSFDVTPHNGCHGALVGFILGSKAARWSAQAADKRRAAVLAQLGRHFGPAVESPVDYLEKDWCADGWTHGCYVSLMPTGIQTRLGHLLREPTGRVHWAGTETATVWNGYLDGAIQSGERAAAEVLGAD